MINIAQRCSYRTRDQQALQYWSCCAHVASLLMIGLVSPSHLWLVMSLVISLWQPCVTGSVAEFSKLFCYHGEY